MSFMGGIFKALGFESETKTKKVKIKPKASYKLKSNKNKRVEDIDGVPVYYPENFDQFRDFMEFARQNKAIIISTDVCDSEVSNKIIDFIKGFCFGKNAKFIPLSDEKLYLILPEGMEVEE